MQVNGGRMQEIGRVHVGKELLKEEWRPINGHQWYSTWALDNIDNIVWNRHRLCHS